MKVHILRRFRTVPKSLLSEFSISYVMIPVMRSAALLSVGVASLRVWTQQVIASFSVRVVDLACMNLAPHIL